jgi:thymidylate synthase (FAD)
MKVTLINHTQHAEDLLLFTKSTRLTLSPALMQEIRDWPYERKLSELAYMANTIPSSWEFVDYTFLVEGVSRAYTHQQVRTRAASYAQQTMRILDMGEFEYVFTARNKADTEAYELIKEHNKATRKTYAALRKLGQPPEDARGVLPTNIATNIICKFNLRTFCEVAKARGGGRTQDEYRKVVDAMVDAVLAVHPWAEAFMFQQGRNHYREIEAFALREYPNDLNKRGELLKIVDQMRKGGAS